MFAETHHNTYADDLMKAQLDSVPGEPGSTISKDGISHRLSKLITPAGQHLRNYYWAYGVVVATASVYATIKLYESGKIKTARRNTDTNNPLRAKLAVLDAQLDKPGLSNSDHAALKRERSKVLTALVSEYFKDKNFIETVKEVATSII